MIPCCICGVWIAARSAGTEAFFSDAPSASVNTMTVGKLETTVVEEFQPTEIKKEESAQISKKAKVTNRGSVPCFVRVLVQYSNEDWKPELQNLDTVNWIYHPKDGRYYYKHVLYPGASTSNLFDGVKIPKEKDTMALTEETEVSIFVSEESVQAEHGGMAFKDYREAWDYYTGQKQEAADEKK